MQSFTIFVCVYVFKNGQTTHKLHKYFHYKSYENCEKSNMRGTFLSLHIPYVESKHYHFNNCLSVPFLWKGHLHFLQLLLFSSAICIAPCYILFHMQKWFYKEFMELKFRNPDLTHVFSKILGAALAIYSDDHSFIYLQYWGVLVFLSDLNIA